MSVAYELTFSHRYVYDSLIEGIQVPVVLKNGQERVDLLARIDTGATYPLFQRDYGESLSLRVEEGERTTIATVNGRFEAYGHELAIEVLGIEVAGVVYFYADSGYNRNVLGRRGWLDRIRLGLSDHDHTLYLSQYDR